MDREDLLMVCVVAIGLAALAHVAWPLIAAVGAWEWGWR